VAHLTGQFDAQATGRTHDLLFVFAHPQYLPHLDELVPQVARNISAAHVLGCTGASVIGLDQEIEGEPAITALAAQLPGVAVQTFHITEEEVEEATGPGYWHFQLEVEPADEPQLILLSDPFSLRITQLAAALNEAFPTAPIVGGLASGARQPGGNRLLLDAQILDAGAVGVALSGNIQLHTLVSQGCKPIGDPYVITRAERNMLYEIGGRPPVKVLQELLPKLPPRDQQLLRTALLLGRVINEYQEDYRRGDFLIRNLIGQDPQTGALEVGDLVRTGQTIQFQVRDAVTADEDWQARLAEQRRELGGKTAAGALLFSCLGRGEHMYGRPHHDVRALQEHLGPLPTAGFFGNGEIGPVGDKVYVHGFTSVLGLFTEAN
jgi:small ligand-binding sensory domain FIST